jgi:integrase
MSHAANAAIHPAQSTPRKRGRPSAEHRLADGTKIIGLARHKGDKRWRISATGETFFEPDERLAVARFEAAMAKARGEDVIELPLGRGMTPEAARRAALDAGTSRYRAYVRRGRPVEYVAAIGSPQFYAAVREMLIDDPIDLSLKTGVEWVARGADLPRPTPSPTLQELIDTYAAKAGITGEEVSRCKRFWKQFAEVVGIKTIRELSHDLVERYERRLAQTDLAPKSVKHRYTGVRTVIAYGLRRGKGPEDCRRALDILAMLEAPKADALDPNPISPADFWAIYDAAVNAGDGTFAALMLFALNAALYGSEVGAVRWDDVDLTKGEFSARRHKTGVGRVAVLWPETTRAIQKLPRDRATVFNTKVQGYNRFSIHREWTAYREAAAIKGVTFAEIRDAAFTVACRVSADQARVLAGHRMAGAVDHYVRRNPGLVADACVAIRKAFSVPAHVK